MIASDKMRVSSPRRIETSGSETVSVSFRSAPTNSRNFGRIRPSLSSTLVSCLLPNPDLSSLTDPSTLQPEKYLTEWFIGSPGGSPSRKMSNVLIAVRRGQSAVLQFQRRPDITGIKVEDIVPSGTVKSPSESKLLRRSAETADSTRIFSCPGGQLWAVRRVFDNL